MKRPIFVLALGLLFGSALNVPVMAQGTQPAITEQEAHAIGVEAYRYFYPLVTWTSRAGR